jgi:tetratricopeptide (TPR) repeat protein
VLQNFFKGSSSSGASASALRKKAQEHPAQAKLWHDLAVKLEADNKLDDAIVALKRYTVLRPKDQNVLEELASIYLRRASAEQQVYIDAQTRSQLLSPGAVVQTPGELAARQGDLEHLEPDPVVRLRHRQHAGERRVPEDHHLRERRSRHLQAAGEAEPEGRDDAAPARQVAEGAGDTKTAIASYKRFLQLAPDDPLAPTAKKALKGLEAQQKASTATSTTGRQRLAAPTWGET